LCRATTANFGRASVPLSSWRCASRKPQMSCDRASAALATSRRAGCRCACGQHPWRVLRGSSA
jgi:hypothetical protein